MFYNGCYYEMINIKQEGYKKIKEKLKYWQYIERFFVDVQYYIFCWNKISKGVFYVIIQENSLMFKKLIMGCDFLL